MDTVFYGLRGLLSIQPVSCMVLWVLCYTIGIVLHWVVRGRKRGVNLMGKESQMQKFYNLLLEFKNKKILFWGASNFLKEFIKNNDLSPFDIEGIVDKNEERWGTLLGGYTIFPPKTLIQKKDLCVIPAIVNNSDKIYQEISAFINLIKSQDVFLTENVFSKEITPKTLSSNHIYIIDSENNSYEVSYLEGLKVVWLGSNSIIKIYSDKLPNIKNMTIYCKSDCEVTIGFNCIIKDLLISMTGDESRISIGNSFTVNSGEIIMGKESGTKIVIGNDCMFSSDIYIRSSDSHTVYDNLSGQIHNTPQEVIIGNHVWLGKGVNILKGAEISDNSVAAARSIVNKKFKESNVVIAGIPAHIVKRNISWDRRCTEEYIATKQ